jgi:hypothetical protein
MTKPRYLTKSRFKLGMECPTKLFYTGNPLYPDKSIDDPFLLALADGGFQVGELAKHYIPGGHEITTTIHAEAERETLELLQQENVVIYEAAIRFESLFIRIDILKKQGNRLELIEVKSKSFHSDDEELPFLTARGALSSSWKPYLYDIAFQAHVLKRAIPDHEIHSYLMIADKGAKCPTDGLNQKFRVKKDFRNRKMVKVASSLSAEDLSVPLLAVISVDEYVGMVWSGSDTDDFAERGFEGTIAWLAEAYEKNVKIAPAPGGKCRDCSFTCSDEELLTGLKSGFRECWAETFDWTDRDFKEQNVLALWDFRKKDEAIAAGKRKLADISEDDLGFKEDDKPGLSRTQRQLLQIRKSRSGSAEPYLDRENLAVEMRGWTYPLHFIDFETTINPIPFTKGLAPYEMVAFQYSHHVVERDGSVRHAGEYLSAEPGVFPNFSFVRALKRELEGDSGTIFRYSNHENSVLLAIYRQLAAAGNPPKDRDELLRFIVSITNANGKKGLSWKSPRNMVDLWHLVKRYYYDSYTKGSNSIKYVLPAVLNSSDFLKEKYGKPIYGAASGIPSLNFTEWQWLQCDERGMVKDPYSLLPKIFTDIDEKNAALLLSSDDDTVIKHGGAAMTAFARLQFEEMTEYEREAIKCGLKKYCELDTMAMVMIYEAWMDWLQ